MSNSSTIQALRTSIHRHIVGKDQVIDYLLTCLLARGHILLEDVPGVGKTSLAEALATSIEGSFQRIQFTSDLLPADIIGVPIFNADKHAFEFHPGPIFSNIVLADEINRTTPKTQSALLEAMQEGQVTVDRETHTLEKPFMVIATQNPIEQYGTYPLPESQLDRFLFRIDVGYPNYEDELKIAIEKGTLLEEKRSQAVCSTEQIATMQKEVTEVRVEASIQEYIVKLVRHTRDFEDIALGVSPRGTIALYKACQAYAYINGRDYLIPDDVKALSLPTLAHRIVPSSNALSRNMGMNLSYVQDNIIRKLIETVEIPM